MKNLTSAQRKIFSIVFNKIGINRNLTDLILSYLPESSILILAITIGDSIRSNDETYRILTRDYTQFFEEDKTILFTKNFYKECSNNNWLNLMKWAYSCNCNSDTEYLECISAETLEWLHEKVNIDQIPYLLGKYAFQNGNMKVIEWLYEHDLLKSSSLFVSLAIKNNHRNVLEYLISKNHIFTSGVLKSAVDSGSLDNIKFVYNDLVTRGIRGLSRSIIPGDFNRNFGDDVFDETIYMSVGEQGNIEIYKYLQSIGMQLEDCILDEAVRHGHLDMIRWIYNNVMNFDVAFEREIVVFASDNNHLHVIEWFYNKSGPNILTDELFESNMYYGNTEILDWLVIKNCPKPYRINYSPKLGEDGKLFIEKYLLKYNIPFSQDFAENCDSYELLKWALLNDCPYNNKMIIYAAFRPRSIEFIKWALIEFKVPWHDDIFHQAAQFGDFELVKWLHSYKPSMEKMTIAYHASLRGNFYILKWLYKKGYKFDSSVCKAVCDYNYLHVLKWLHKIGVPYFKDELLTSCKVSVFSSKHETTSKQNIKNYIMKNM